MAGHSLDVERLRTTAAQLDSRFARAHDLVRMIDTFAVPQGHFGGIGASAATSYAGAHQRKMTGLDRVVSRLRTAGSMATTVADRHEAADRAAAARLADLRWEQS